MPLQIRRGTSAEKNTLASPPVAGELIWITDEARLYIGDGVTLAGDLSPVTGYSDDNAKDAAADIFTAGSHSGISFSYDGSTSINATVSYPALLQNLNTNGFDISGNGNINITGSIIATSFVGDYKGSISADDSTILVDALNGSINLLGTVKGDIVPDQTASYDIGSVSNQFNAIFLTSSGLNVGAANVTSTGSSINLPAGSTVGGVPIGTAELISGTNHNINIVGDDSSLIVDSSALSVTAVNGFFGDLTGNSVGLHIGEMKGSLFGDDSSILVDGIDGRAYLTSIETSSILAPSNRLVIDSIDQIRLNSQSQSGFRTLAVIQDGTIGNAPQFDFHGIRGTPDSPLPPNVGDYISAIRFTYYEGVADFGNAVATLTAQIDPAANLSHANPASNLVVLVNAGDGLGFSGLGIQPFTFKKEGTFDAPILKTGTYANDTARNAYITSPEAGMIIFNLRDDSTGVPQFQGYDGTAWVDLH